MLVNKSEIDNFKQEILEIKEEVVNKPYYNFEIVTTQLCNMRCTYCLEDGFKTDPRNLNNDLPKILERIDAILDDDWMMGKFRGVAIDFWGGEPTNNFYMIEKVIYNYINDNRVRFHIYTNGYDISKLKLLVKDLIKRNQHHKLEVQFSYDGKPIHDKRRLGVGGSKTSEIVLAHAKEIYNLGKNISFKPTITDEDFCHLSEVWDEFAELADIFKSEKRLMYYPTIDTTRSPDLKYLDIFKQQVIKIAKKELEYYKKHGSHLWKWFEVPQKSFCSAGKTSSCLDISGNSFVCHGAMYLKSKDDHIVWSINDSTDTFLSKIKEKYITFEKNISNIELSEECLKCEATMCMRCNIVKYEESHKKDYYERWTDYTNNQPLCEYYKTFGKIHRALRKLKQEN